MKYIISIIAVLFIMSGCTNLSTPDYNKSSKEQLINSANAGDIKAMVALNKNYNFPETKEGLKYYNKWINLIDNKKNSKDIISFAKVFKNYKDMFINGNLKYEKLLNLAKDDKDTLFLLLNHYINAHKYEKEVDTKDAILKNATKEDLQKLYDIYTKSIYKARGGHYEYKAKEIRDLMVKKGFINENKSSFFYLDKIYESNNKTEIDNILNKIYNSNSFEDIYQSAKLLKSEKDKRSIKFYEKAITLTDDKKIKSEIYYDLYFIYTYNKAYNINKDEQKQMDVLKKSFSLGSDKAKYSLTIKYRNNKKYKDEYEQLKEDYFKTIEGKKEFANILYKGYARKEAYKIWEELASTNHDEDSIIALAFKQNAFAAMFLKSKSDDVSKKWQHYIIEHPNKSLIEKAKKKFFDNSSSKKFEPNFLETILKKDLKEQNIITLRNLYDYYRFSNGLNAFKYLQSAVNAGDVKSKIQLSQLYFKRKSSVNKGLDILKELSKEGDISATTRLADFYFYPSYKFKSMANPKLGIEYFEKAVSLGDTNSLKALYNIYSCTTCKEKLTDFKKAKYYAEELTKKGRSDGYFELAKFYYYGVETKKDLKKALEYFEKAAKYYYAKAYYELGLLYYEKSKVTLTIDNKKALDYFKKGAQLKNFDCNYILGDIYVLGYAGVKKDKEKAIEYYKRIAYLDKNVAFYIGYYYINDKKDYENAAKYFEKSLNSKTGKGYYELAYLYENGLGVKQDVFNALRFYDKAYKLANDKQAAFQIAKILHYGKGKVPQNKKIAKEWYEVVGSKEAKKQIKLLENIK
ncbi:hypothetical protein CPU12_11145 [Malaciobacter molluscorum LMG 25693]|uniref:beta-lactamase n=1 Tax=Malaciobacter molluscorum LMG 25693 TaxID=870501 RepID=A0A2G1DFJ2_9BACT|nr:SEL1-like repeat protein [Malaciobacter molluscorum]AXX93589.1 Sel1 domain-containing protein [Malaciobacter molluscorum LMG 25693]PHO17257.1 hypothetical protein CPU12_11145 [Malaciobacter molluscorum LMG 25693]